MRKYRLALSAAIIAFLFLPSDLTAFLPFDLTAFLSGQNDYPLLRQSDLQYLGGFTVPVETVNGANFEYGGSPMAYNPANNSLFLGGAGKIAEITIPSLVTNTDPNALQRAGFRQPFFDPTEGHLAEVGGGSYLSGLMVYGNRLIGTATIFYDADYAQRMSHYSRSLQLNQPSFSGWSQLWPRAGYVSGGMSPVPAEWQGRLGGPALTGQCCLPIITRTSFGPAAMSFDPVHIGSPLVPVSPLLYYPTDHATLGPWSGSNPTYGAATTVAGMAVIAGTRTVLYVGRNGLGAYCYGSATGDQSKVGTIPPEGGEPYCYDPVDPAKSQHAYPYRYQIWAYDLNDLAAVKAGTKQPWEVLPYGVWPLSFPTPELRMSIGGVGYDAVRQILYVSQLRADGVDVYRPVIHAFKINAAAGASPDTGTTEPLTSVSLTPNRVAPQAPRTPITWYASAVGGATPRQYKWLVSDGVTTTVAANWSTLDAFNWTPSSANANYRVTVWARDAASTVDAPEASASAPFAIQDATVSPSSVSSVSISANKVDPQATGTAIVWSAVAVGGASPLGYKWWVFDGATWNVVANWSAASTFTWTPTVANANYRVGVWVKSAANAADQFEASTEKAFAITGAATTSPTLQVSSVSLTANKDAPQAAGTQITWSAVATGGTAPLVYKWWVFDGSTFSGLPNWSPSSSFTWTAAVANPNYRVGVWVKSAGNPADQYEASAEKGFAIAAPTSAAPPSTTVRSVTISANKVEPQVSGTAINWAAVATGGTGPLAYKWWVFDGATWNVVANWSAASTFTWMPTVANPNYRIAVGVKSAANTADQFEASTEKAFAITVPAATSPALKLSSVSVSANKVEPQVPGTQITWSAVATGGTGLVYKWWVFDGSTWSGNPNWTPSSSFTWTPAVANPNYRVGVWVKSADNPADQYEASAEKGFAIAAPASSTSPPPSATPPTVSSVTLSANMVEQLGTDTAISWSAVATGGTGPLAYKWWVFDGVTWNLATNWTPSSTFPWTVSVTNLRYAVGVWVKSAGNPADQPEASFQSTFATSGSGSTTTAPTPW